MSNTTTSFGPVSLTREGPPTHPVWRVAARLFAGLFARLRAAHQTRCDLAYLQACDDRTLADIGLTRNQIEGAIRLNRYY